MTNIPSPSSHLLHSIMTVLEATSNLHNPRSDVEVDTGSSDSVNVGINISNSTSDDFHFGPSVFLHEHVNHVQSDSIERASQGTLASPDSPSSSEATVTPRNYMKNKRVAYGINASSEELGVSKKSKVKQREEQTDNPANDNKSPLALSSNSKVQPTPSCGFSGSTERRSNQASENWSKTSNGGRLLTWTYILGKGPANDVALVTHWLSSPLYDKVHQSDHARVPNQGTVPHPHRLNRNLNMPTNPYYQLLASPCPIAHLATTHVRQLSDPFIDNQPQQAVNNVYLQTRTAVEKLVNEYCPQEYIIGSKIVYAQDVKALGKDLSTDPRTHLPSSPLPLPPPTQNLPHAIETRNRVEMRKAARENWIRTEAKKIADLYRAKVAATQTYLAYPTPHTHTSMRNANLRFEESVDLAKRQEERRNLFLKDKGMTALKTGPENLASDGHAGLRPSALGRSGVLLGSSMALMERVCAEAVGRNSEKRKHS